MVDTNLLLIGGAAAVGAFFLGYLCKPFNLCPPNFTGAQNQLFPAATNPSIPKAGGTASKPDYTGQQNALFPSAVGYAYSGYTSAPLTVA